jgi:hypothetical protein
MQLPRLQQEPDRYYLPYSGLIHRLVARLPEDNLWSLPARALLDQNGQFYPLVSPLVDGRRLAALVETGLDTEGQKTIVAAWLLGQGHLLSEHREPVIQTLSSVLEKRQKGQHLLKRTLRQSLRRVFPWSLLLGVLCFLFFAGLTVQHELILEQKSQMTNESSSHSDTSTGISDDVGNTVTWGDSFMTWIGRRPHVSLEASNPTIAEAEATGKVLVMLAILLPPLVFVGSWLGIGLLIAPWVGMRIASDSQYLCANTALSLGYLGGPQSINVLAETAVRDASPEIRQAAEEALARVLPALTEDYYGRLQARTVPNLCLLLDRGGSLTLALLEALSKVGDGRAVHPVERVAAHGGTASLREAAANILPILQERYYRETSAAILLRPVQAQESESASLLRPTVDTGSVRPEQMLRAIPPSEL